MGNLPSFRTLKDVLIACYVAKMISATYSTDDKTQMFLTIINITKQVLTKSVNGRKRNKSNLNHTHKTC